MTGKLDYSRRYDLDFLRILATLLLIPYHTARIFDSSTFYIQNEINSPILELFTRFIDMWFMPLFFFIAGVAAKYSLDLRGKKQYLIERFQRLFIPLIFGIFFLVPIIGYFGFITHNSQISYYQYYPHFFNFSFEHIDGFTGTFTPSHLWFILYLFCFSLITLPLFQYFNSEKGEQLIANLAESLSQNTTLIFLAAIPLTLARMTGLVYYNFTYYLLFFILGYLFLLDRRFEQSMERNRVALILGLMGMLFYLYSRINEFHLVYEFSPSNILIQLLLSLNTLSWIIVILNFARKYLNWTKPLIKYLNEASYPIYILHMSFIMYISFYVVQWQVGIMEKVLFINITSTISIIFVYELMNKFNITRFLLGMKLKKCS